MTPESPLLRPFVLRSLTAALVLAIALIVSLSLSAPDTDAASDDSGSCGANLTYTFTGSNGEMFIYGTGAMDDFYIKENAPWDAYRGAITRVVIEDGVTGIGYNAFRECTQMRSLRTNGNSISIGDSAFYGCTSLTEAVMPGVISIGDRAFSGCEKMTMITIEAASVGEYAFGGCTALEQVYIGSGLSSIGNKAFYGCDSLRYFNVAPGNANYCSDMYGVLYNKSQTDILIYPVKCACKAYVMPETVASVGADTFRGNDSIESVTVSSHVSSIGDWAFYGCHSLRSVTLPDSVTSIGDHAFSGCWRLDSFTI